MIPSSNLSCWELDDDAKGSIDAEMSDGTHERTEYGV